MILMRRLFGVVALLCPAWLLAGNLEFRWGESYANLRAGLADGTFREEKAGEFFRYRKGGLLYTYHFHQPREIEKLDVKKDDQGRITRQKVELRPVGPVDQARLYAVEISYDTPLAEDVFSKELLPDLEQLYGKASNPADLSFDMENQTTMVRTYLFRYKDKKYIQKLVFHSIELSLEQKRDTLKLREAIDRALKEAAERTESGTLPAPDGLSAEMIAGEP